MAICGFNAFKMLTERLTNTSYIKSKVSNLDRELFKARNDLLVLKRELAEGKGPIVTTENHSPIVKEVVKEIPPKALLIELENLKHEKSQLLNQNQVLQSEMEQNKNCEIEYQNQVYQLNEELNSVKNQLDQAQQELNEAESVVQECVEEKKKLNTVNNEELVTAIDTLRNQLNSQKEAVHKYEGKIKRRDSGNNFWGPGSIPKTGHVPNF